MQIHELENFSGALDSGTFAAVDNGTDTGKVSVPGLLKQALDGIEAANDRIDNIIAGGTAPSAAEVTDARLGANGLTYASLGQAIRDQIAPLDLLRRSIVNLKDGCLVGFLNGSGIVNDAVTVYSTSDFIKVKAGDVFSYKLKSAAGGSLIAYYNTPQQSDFVSKLAADGTEQIGTYTVVNDGYIRVGWANVFANDLYFYNSNYVPHVVAQLTNEAENNAISHSDESALALYKKIYNVTNDNVTDGFINNSGIYNANALYGTTDFLPIKSGESFDYKLSHGTTLPIISFFDTTKTYDGSKSVIGVAGYSEGTYTASADGFVRFTFSHNLEDIFVEFTKKIPDNVAQYIGEIAVSNEVPQMTIVCLGDSIFNQADNITDPLAKLTGATIINGACGGTRATSRGGSDPFQYFDGVNLVDALVNNSWSDQDTAAAALSGSYPWITTQLARLKSIDMSDVDILFFNWATNDYAAAVSMADIITAHNYIIDKIQAAYPAIRILIISPIWRYLDTPGDNKNGDNYAPNGSTLKEISAGIVQNAKDKRISVFDAYVNMPLNYNTASTYFFPDSGVHPNNVGGKLFAHYLNGFINSIC